MRDLEKKPYSEAEKRIVKYFSDMGAPAPGVDDPIAFIIASHMALAAERRRLMLQLAAEKSRHHETLMAVALGAGA